MNSDDDEWDFDDDEVLVEDEWEDTIEFEADDWRHDYDSELDAIVDACHGAKMFNDFADFAPIHAVFDFITECIEEIGHDVHSESGTSLTLQVAAIVLPDDSIMEHNRNLACFYCCNEVEPIVDIHLVRRCLDYRCGKIPLQELYRCPECGGGIHAKVCAPQNSDRHLPWFHYVHGDDFDVSEENKPSL